MVYKKERKRIRKTPYGKPGSLGLSIDPTSSGVGMEGGNNDLARVLQIFPAC